ncbi:MAG: hypothetical protein LAO03_05270 [Acidobacteriia bacterium]|nr:hypothetical protein [Terriglobia bacterium]
MKRIASVGIALALVAALSAQDKPSAAEAASEPIQGKSRTEVVDEVWRMATQGELLTPEGWRQACGFYTNPTPFSGNKMILVMSNDWGPSYEDTLKGDSTDVEMGYVDMGKIDFALHYTPPPKTEFVKTGFLYHLVTVPAYLMMYGPDGKTLVEKKPVGYRVWQIQGSPGLPWTTVNTAIRYVLEMRNKTTDPAIKNNADQTIAKLLKMH